MVCLGICVACQMGNHGDCEGHMPPPNSTACNPVFGGFSSICPCHGDKDYKDENSWNLTNFGNWCRNGDMQLPLPFKWENKK